MLIQLNVKNLGLIDDACFKFEKGFTSITGETGSGKTSLIEAIKLSLGKKSDFEFIKNGQQQALVESFFELKPEHPIYSFLKNESLAIEEGEILIFKRILSREGKTKAYINQQPVSVHLLQKCAPFMIAIIDQHSNFELDSSDFFLKFIDSMLDDPQILEEVQSLYLQKQSLLKEIDELFKKTVFKDLRIEELEFDIKELADVKVSEDDENALFESFKKAQSFAQSAEKIGQHLQMINEELLPQVRRLRSDKIFSEDVKKMIETSFIHLQELSFNLEKQLDESQSDPSSLKKMETTLNLIHKLKRKHSSKLSDFPSILENKKNELETLYRIDDLIEEKKDEKEKLEQEFNKKTQVLSALRKQKALILQENLASSLRPLNMPFVELDFVFSPSSGTVKGTDVIELFIQQNQNAAKVEALSALSGGELARLNFSLFLEKSKLSPSFCWIFDEIDSSVGGITSALMGDKLKELSFEKQVFCITHFPQMASKADHHYAFEKMQSLENLEVFFKYSTQGPINEEIDRMIGVKE